MIQPIIVWFSLPPCPSSEGRGRSVLGGPGRGDRFRIRILRSPIRCGLKLCAARDGSAAQEAEASAEGAHEEASAAQEGGRHAVGRAGPAAWVRRHGVEQVPQGDAEGAEAEAQGAQLQRPGAYGPRRFLCVLIGMRVRGFYVGVYI